MSSPSSPALSQPDAALVHRWLVCEQECEANEFAKQSSTESARCGFGASLAGVRTGMRGKVIKNTREQSGTAWYFYEVFLLQQLCFSVRLCLN